MIQLKRSRSAGVPKRLCGKERLHKNLTLISGRLSGNLSFNSNYWKSGKKQLKIESCGKCAYCEAPTAVVAHGDVEHFRPKKIYWWLAYCYDNHLYACQICNQSYKSDHFPVGASRMSVPRMRPTDPKSKLESLAAKFGPDPVDDTAGMPLAQFQTAARKERALLIDPYLFNPEEYFAWEVDPDLKEVRIKAATRTGARQVLQTAERHLGLNREELQKIRYRVYEKLETYRDVLHDKPSKSLRTRVESQICSMISNEAEFAGMSRFFVRLWKLKLNCGNLVIG
jgi:hypothetical protein